MSSPEAIILELQYADQKKKKLVRNVEFSDVQQDMINACDSLNDTLTRIEKSLEKLNNTMSLVASRM